MFLISCWGFSPVFDTMHSFKYNLTLWISYAVLSVSRNIRNLSFSLSIIIAYVICTTICFRPHPHISGEI